MTSVDGTFSLTNLADLANSTPRTIRYYIAQGLLPAPFGGGPATRYNQGHLDRLRLIRSLQRQHLPLAEIRSRVEGLSDEEVAALVAREPASPPRPESAIEYIRELLAPAQTASVPAPPKTQPHLRFALSAAPPTPAPGAVYESGAPYDQSTPAPDRAASLPGPSRSQWERVALDPNIELHVRRPLSRHQNRAVERLVAFARQALEEDPS